MHNRTLILFFFVLAGGVLGVVVGGMHTPASGNHSAKGVRRAVNLDAGAKSAAQAPARVMTVDDKRMAEERSRPNGTPAVAMTPSEEPVARMEPGTVPVAGTANASSAGAPAARKSLIPGPDDVGQTSSEGKQ